MGEAFTIAFRRRTAEGDWVPVGLARFIAGRVVAHSIGLSGLLLSDALVTYLRDRVAFGTARLGGEEYRWDEVASESGVVPLCPPLVPTGTRAH